MREATNQTRAVVRIASPADTPALTRLINAAYRVEEFFLLGDRTDEQEVAALMNGADSAFLVIDDAAVPSLIGSVFVRRTGDRGYLGLLAVDPGRQGSGFGRQLVHAAENHFRRIGCRHVDLDVVDLRTELPPFYHALGYIETGSTAPFPKPERLRRPAHLVLMTRSLSS